MRVLALAGYLLVILLAGCSKEAAKDTAHQNVAYKPSTLLKMKDLPSGEVEVVGQLVNVQVSKGKAETKLVMLFVEDRGVKTTQDDIHIIASFEPGAKDFSESFLRWLNQRRDGDYVSIRGKLVRIEKDVYLRECQATY